MLSFNSLVESFSFNTIFLSILFGTIVIFYQKSGTHNALVHTSFIMKYM